MKDVKSMKIIATASHLPEKVVTNFDLEKLVDTSDEWITKRTGIKQRHIATTETTSSMATKVAEDLIKQAQIDAEAIRLIIVATMSPDHTTPSTASVVQGSIGATNAVCFDLAAACSGFVYAMSVADKLAQFYQDGYVLVIGSEKMSRVLDWQDRSTCVLFGDGAGGLLIDVAAKNADNGQLILAEDIRSDGSKCQAIVAGGNHEPNVFTPEAGPEAADSETKETHYMVMAGREVYDFATRTLPKHIAATLHKANITGDELDYLLLHQANSRILEVMARKLKLPGEKIPSNVAECANTSGASIPILLDGLVKANKIRLDGTQTICMSGFGGGLTWGTIVVKI